MDGESEATRTTASTASFSISHVQRTDMREQSETSLILKTEMKQPELKKKICPGTQVSRDKGRSSIHPSPSIRWPLSLTTATRSSQADRASSSEAACTLTGHDVSVNKAVYQTHIQCRMTCSPWCWGGSGLGTTGNKIQTGHSHFLEDHDHRCPIIAT